jgi:hypothetical protein
MKIYTTGINGNIEYYTTFKKAYDSISNKIEKELHGIDEDQNQTALYIMKGNPLFGEQDPLMRLGRISWIDVK